MLEVRKFRGKRIIDSGYITYDTPYWRVVDPKPHDPRKFFLSPRIFSEKLAYAERDRLENERASRP